MFNNLNLNEMAKVVYSNGIDYISGALNKVKRGGQHDHEKMLLATHRVAATESKHCNRIYLREKPQRRTSPGANELRARARFGAVAAMVKARSKNLSLMTSDQQAFIAQKDLADGKKTLRAYYWYICGQEYDQEHGN